MSLDIRKLEKVVDLGNGVRRARCPACAEGGGDRKGEHLRIYPDGKFGCCVHAGDHVHRQRIFALAGERVRRGIAVKMTVAKQRSAIQTGIFSRIVPMVSPAIIPDGPDGGVEVETDFEDSRTPRTGETESTASVSKSDQSELFDKSEPILRTPRTPSLNPRVYINKESEKEVKGTYTLKGFQGGVRSVREEEIAVVVVPHAEKPGRLPFLTADGSLRIPFDSPERYHWWKDGGQDLDETLKEVKERSECGDEY